MQTCTDKEVEDLLDALRSIEELSGCNAQSHAQHIAEQAVRRHYCRQATRRSTAS